MHGAFLFIVVTAYFLFCLATFPLQIAMIVMGKFIHFQLRLKNTGGWGTPRMKVVGMLIVSLRGINFGFLSHLGCCGQNAIIFGREGLV